MADPRYTLGIDPTALALYDAQEPAQSCVWDMPADAQGIQASKLVSILEEVIQFCADSVGPHIDVQAVVRDPQGSQFEAGLICGELASFAIPYTFGHTPGQGTAQRARQMFPDMAHLFDKEGRPRALMMAVHRNQP